MERIALQVFASSEIRRVLGGSGLMKRTVLTLALVLVLTSANSSQACDWLFGCGGGCSGGFGISLSLCGLSIGFDDMRSTYAGGCCGAAGQGTGKGLTIGMASSYEQWPGRSAALQAWHTRIGQNRLS